MLLKFSARNFNCFREGIEVSLELGGNCPTSISHGKSCTNVLCIKGANASGKTSLLKILGFLKDFCSSSFDYKPEQDIPVNSFFNNDEQIDICCEYTVEGTKYRYEVGLTRKRVIIERVSRKSQRWSVLFERTYDELNECIKEFAELYNVKLRPNASIISMAHQYQIVRIEVMYTFFSSFMSNVTWWGRTKLFSDYSWMSEWYTNNEDVLNKSKDIIREFDLGIEDISIESVEKEDGKLAYFPVFTHKTNAPNKKLYYYAQSLGTKTLYWLLPYLTITLDRGGLLVLDEFDTELHPHILWKLVSLFDNAETNHLNAQLVFTTHNTEIMDLLSKYQTFLVNKEEGESFGYRLDEIPGELIRNDRPLSPIYNSGRIGGVPHFG